MMILVKIYLVLLLATDYASRHCTVSHGFTSFELIVRPWFKYRADHQPGRELTLVPNVKITDPVRVTLTCDGKKQEWSLTPAQRTDSISVLLPANVSVTKDCIISITLTASQQSVTRSLVVHPQRQWTIYIYPHAHVDVGYTALQETVEKLHVRNIDVGIDLARKTKDYPAGARFVWNPEATWVVNSYLKQATPVQQRSFVEAVRKGWLQIDAGHSNMNTSICSDEELIRSFTNVHTIRSLTGVPVTTMVQMDVAGAAWGLVQAAAQNGVKGFINFPNYYDLRKTWEHKPFYWVAPDGKSRIFFLQACPYGVGYTLKGSQYGLRKIQSFTPDYDRLSSANPMAHFIDPFIFEETRKLERAGSPYDLFAMTWSMADNCLIDADLPEAVKQWNATYAYPKLIIAGAATIMQAYEKKYKDIIPTYRGDFTEFWTDGVGSDARRVALSRKAKENLVQAETLWSLLQPDSVAPVPQFTSAWDNLLLAAEHTWGYQVPGTPLAKEVEARKAAFFENAYTASNTLITQAAAPVTDSSADTIAVINTLSWARSGLVVLPAAQSKAGDQVVNDAGQEVPAQRLTTGELVFQPDSIPALSSQLYRVVPGKYSQPTALMVTDNSLQNEYISLAIDKHTGGISRLYDLSANRQLVDTASPFVWNSYHYLTGVCDGRDSIREHLLSSDIVVRIKEQGPLIASLLISSKAPGCKWLTREVQLVKGQRMVQFLNVMDKIATRNKEGVHFGFAFNIPAGYMRLDVPWGIMIPEQDQLPGANRNWMAFQRWIDVSNADHGITWTAIESPIIELGGITGTILDGARQAPRWIKQLPATQTIVSWPVNNHWGTNFSPEQEGVITNTYRILLHDAYDAVAANRFGMEQHRPLIAIPANKNPLNRSLLSLSNKAVVVTALKRTTDNKALMVRLRSVGAQPETVTISYPSGLPREVYVCTPDEKPFAKSNSHLMLPPYGTVSLRMVFN